MTDQVQTPRALPDPQDPLPEASWLWRRVFTFVALVLAFGVVIGLSFAVNRIVGNIVGRIDSMDARNVAQITVVALHVIERMFRMMFYTVLVVVTYYMVAPSAEQITKMIQTARLLRGGVTIASQARVTRADVQEETRAQVGIPEIGKIRPVSDDSEPPARQAPEPPWGGSGVQAPPPLPSGATFPPRPQR